MDVQQGDLLWQPAADRVATTRLAGFRRAVADAGGPAADTTYAALHRWSIDKPAEFWRLVWEDGGIIGDPGAPDRVLVGPPLGEPGHDLRETRFFPDARLNVAENLLAPRPGVAEDHEAVVAVDEQGNRRALTWAELRAEVAAAAAALAGEGVIAGSHVAVYLPAGIEALVTAIATFSLGAIYTSTSPDFGVEGVVDRFGQVEPVVLVATTGYRYNGKRFDVRSRLGEIVARLPSVRRVVAVPESGDDGVGVGGGVGVASDGAGAGAGDVRWDDWVRPHAGHRPHVERFPFDQPMYVLYSSGTTGRPKCIEHAAGRVLLKHVQEQQHHGDVRPGDRLTWFTTTGWMMWNWLISPLASGATIVLVDGSPFHPDARRLFDLAVSERLTHLGLSAKFLDSCHKAGVDTREALDGSPLRMIGSTGSPLSAESAAYVYEHLMADVHLAPMSGGTDLCGCFISADPTGPVRAGEMQVATLGMAVEVFDPEGQEIDGAPGELVCTRPFPSQPLGFFGDDTSTDAFGARYTAAYFDRFPGVWTHGDFITHVVRPGPTGAADGYGGYVIHGRSDTTLNPGGVRIGTAEIYRVVDDVPAVLESLVFGQQWDGDTRIVLLVRLADGHALTDELAADLRQRIRTRCSPRHVPAVICAVDDLPRTRSNKLVELAVSDAVNGRPVRNTEAIANPEAIWAIVDRPELKA